LKQKAVTFGAIATATALAFLIAAAITSASGRTRPPGFRPDRNRACGWGRDPGLGAEHGDAACVSSHGRLSPAGLSVGKTLPGRVSPAGIPRIPVPVHRRPRSRFPCRSADRSRDASTFPGRHAPGGNRRPPRRLDRRLERYLIHDIVPWVDSNLPAIRSRTARTLAGLSAVGFGAVDIGLRHPSLFGTLEAWSGYFHPLRVGALVHRGRASV